MKKTVGYLIIATGIFIALLAVLMATNAYVSLFDPSILSLPVALQDTLEYEEQTYQLYGMHVAPILIILCAIFFVPYCFTQGRKLIQSRVIDKEKHFNADEPFILYLRSFIDDRYTQKTADRFFDPGQSEESILVSVLARIAPVIAIGNPLDKQNLSGATRIYVSEDEWKSNVIEWATKAKIVVLRLGETTNFWWEVEMCLKTINRNKLLFLIPYSHNFNAVATLYKYLIDSNSELQSLSVEINNPTKGSISSIVYFEENGYPVCHNIPKYRFASLTLSLEDLLCNSLIPFFNRYGLNLKKISIGKSRVIQFIAIIVSIILIWGIFLVDPRNNYPEELYRLCNNNSVYIAKTNQLSERRKLEYTFINREHGKVLLADEDLFSMYCLEATIYASTSLDEFQAILKSPINILLAAKKYLSPELYELFLNLSFKSIILNITTPNKHKLSLEEISNEVECFYETAPDTLIQYLSSDEEIHSTEELYTMQLLMDQIIFKMAEDSINVTPLIRFCWQNSLKEEKQLLTH